jgi:hypothetical protein
MKSSVSTAMKSSVRIVRESMYASAALPPLFSLRRVRVRQRARTTIAPVQSARSTAPISNAAAMMTSVEFLHPISTAPRILDTSTYNRSRLNVQYSGEARVTISLCIVAMTSAAKKKGSPATQGIRACCSTA